jgi:hypothetical protein
MSKKLTSLVLIGILGGCAVALFIGFRLYSNYNRPSQNSLPSPLEVIEFPAEPTQYPVDWPDDLKFPEEFVLVDSTTGQMPESTTTGWSAKLRYQGKPSDAVELASAFFKEKGWTILQKIQMDSGGFTLILQREQGSGIIVIETDPNNNSETLIVATLFPKKN